MRKPTVFLFGLLLMLLAANLLCSTTAAGAPLPTPALARAVIGGGGGISISATQQIHTTIGQPAAGRSGDLCAGFWCLLVSKYRVYLPVISEQ